MSVSVWWCLLSICTLPVIHCDKTDNNVGFGLELILTKLESLEFEMMSLKEQNRNLTDLLTEVLTESTKFCSKESGKAEIKEEAKILEAKKEQVDIANPASQASESEPEFDERNVYSSCFEVPPGKSGKFLIRPVKGMKPFYVYCEMQLHGGGWTLVQNRFNGSENFYRNWAEYKNGFGSLDREFWYGLDRIHLLTNVKPHEVMFVLMDFKKMMKYARYNPFAIGNETEGYHVKELGPYTGTAGDSFSYHKDMKFTTYDVDNDKYLTNCAKKYYGAWWYNGCFKSNLNGKYINARNDLSMSWNTFKNGNDGLYWSKIMIREV